MVVDDIKEAKVASVKCKKSLLFHTRYFFKKRQGRKFVLNDHHYIIEETLNRVVRGELTRVIFNIAPRYTKTELIVKNFISWCLANNPRAKFIHLSYSDDLALDNSEEVKDIVTSDEYQLLFPGVQLKKDSKSKKKWYTTKGGGVYATSSSGQVTGFGAGLVDNDDDEISSAIDYISDCEGFGGAIIIDDPMKPDDAYTITRDKVNNKFDTTIRNRVNSRKTPIIIVMQRLHMDDLCGYLINNEGRDDAGGVWHVVSLPVIKQDGTALWPFKHNIDELNQLKKINPHVFETQYMQNPQPKSGLILTNWRYGDFDETLPHIYGLDFGSRDPDAMTKVAVDERNKLIYVDETIYQNGNGTDDLYSLINSSINQNALIVADSQATRTIEDLERKKLNIIPAQKQKVTEDIKVLKDYTIVVTERSYNLVRELNTWVWLDKKGDVPLDDNNHLLDSMRYAFNFLVKPKRKGLRIK